MFKDDFPLIQNTNTIYLDTAASAQKPSCVLEAMDTFYQTYYASIVNANTPSLMSFTFMLMQ